MQRTTTFFLLACASLSTTAQDDALKQSAAATSTAFSAADTSGRIWTTDGTFMLNVTQVNLTNWSAGGASSVGGLAQFMGFANMHKGRWIWDNAVSAAFGGNSVDGQDPVKTDDRLQLTSRVGRELKHPWYASFLVDFKTQFTEGFDATTGARISNLFAPAYLTLALGLDYKPNDKFNAFFSPASARITYVNDETLADFGAFGVEPAEYDPVTLALVTHGEKTRFEFGAYARAGYITDLTPQLKFMTRAELYSNYLEDPQNVDVLWETLFTLKVKDWLGVTLNTLLLYDHDVLIVKEHDDGTPYAGPATQFKETFGLGLTLKM